MPLLTLRTIALLPAGAGAAAIYAGYVQDLAAFYIAVGALAVLLVLAEIVRRLEQVASDDAAGLEKFKGRPGGEPGRPVS
jgi:hypothetical protein